MNDTFYNLFSTLLLFNVVPLKNINKRKIYMALANIVWVDDEIDSLRSQIMFLESKGYRVETFTNGYDAIDYIKQEGAHIVLLDESMPGITGLETLSQIKTTDSTLPIVLITKNETENLMEEAIGSQISDYLIKPVNPHQILLSLKKILESKTLISEKRTNAYQQAFRQLFMELNDNPNHEQWMDIYKKLVFWEMEMEKTDSPEMQEVLATQKQEANVEFGKFVARNYVNWIVQENDAPIMSHHLLASKVLPELSADTPLFFVLIDNLRLDQWKTIQPLFAEYFKILQEDTFYSILPTATQYSRNAIFAGMLPGDIEKTFPDKWVNDDDEQTKNSHEEFFLSNTIKRVVKNNIKYSYTKVLNNNDGQNLVNNIHNLLNNDFNVIVYNFVDMLSHARTELEVLKELAGDEISYRSITRSWLEHSPLFQALKKIADKKIKVVIATDHGSIRVSTPYKIVGDRQTTTNLRYKHGKNLNYTEKNVLIARVPGNFGLPSPNLNSSYVFIKEDGFFCYPNNYNHYANYYKNTFQHGGLSLEEMIIPVVVMESKG